MTGKCDLIGRWEISHSSSSSWSFSGTGAHASTLYLYDANWLDIVECGPKIDKLDTDKFISFQFKAKRKQMKKSALRCPLPPLRRLLYASSTFNRCCAERIWGAKICLFRNMCAPFVYSWTRGGVWTLGGSIRNGCCCAHNISLALTLVDGISVYHTLR